MESRSREICFSYPTRFAIWLRNVSWTTRLGSRPCLYFNGSDSSAKPTIQAIMQEFLRSDIGVLLQLIGLKATRCWYGLWNKPYESFTKWIQLGYLLLALAGFIRYYRTKRLTLISVLPPFLILYFWGTTLLLIPLLRYMIPAMPFVFLYVAAFFLQRVWLNNLADYILDIQLHNINHAVALQIQSVFIIISQSFFQRYNVIGR